MKKLSWPLIIVALLVCNVADAQFGYGRMRMGGRPGPGQHRFQQNLPAFKPSVNISIGYGFPNIDKYELVDFYGMSKGRASQTGPLMASVDYQFSRFMSIGVIATHGKVSVPYYDYGSTTPAFTGSLDNWSIMLDLVRYIPAGKVVSPYLRTAVGINAWRQNYIDPSGNKAADPGDPSALAYQASIGARFNLSKSAGLFIEAGYGKYILNGGLALRFK
jgi:hypothetical protein